MKFTAAKRILALITVVAALGAAAPATARASSLSLLGGLHDITNTGGSLGWTAGAELGFMLVPMVDFELGGQYVARTFSGGGHANYLNVPGILRVWLGPTFGIGAGIVYGAPLDSGLSQITSAEGSLRLKLGMTPLFLGANVLYQLNTSSGASALLELQGLLGIRLGL